MFKDLLKNNESEEENKEYKQLINQCVNENYIVNWIFKAGWKINIVLILIFI